MTRSHGIDLACKNGTVIVRLGKTMTYNETTRTFRVLSKHQGSDQEAVWYIVVVLLFYSLGIIIAIVTYLKRERAEIEEERSYENYFNFKLDPDKHARYFRVKQVAMQLQILEEERMKRMKTPLEKDRPRKASKRRHSRSHSWHFGTLSPFTSPARTPTSPTRHPTTHNLKLTLPASLAPPGFSVREALSLSSSPVSPNFSASFIAVQSNTATRESLSLNIAPIVTSANDLSDGEDMAVKQPEILVHSPSPSQTNDEGRTSTECHSPSTDCHPPKADNHGVMVTDL